MHKLKENVTLNYLKFGGKLPTLDMVLDEMVQEDQEGAVASGLAEAADDIEVQDGDDDLHDYDEQREDAYGGFPCSRGDTLDAEVEAWAQRDHNNA